MNNVTGDSGQMLSPDLLRMENKTIEYYRKRVDLMMELSKRIEELLEQHDFSVCGQITDRTYSNDGYDVELETYSPAGEDIIVSLIYDGTEEGFIKAFRRCAEGFDAEEHAEMWIESRGKNGIPNSIKDLLEDAEWIKDTLMRIAEELNNLNEEGTEPCGCMNREQFYQYVLDNFNISGEAVRLIDNILEFVDNYYSNDKEEQFRALQFLLDGIGLEDEELEKVKMY